MGNIHGVRDLKVYQAAMEVAMELFHLTKALPEDEKYSMTDQVRRSSRSVCTNLAEAWRKRRYAAHWISKLSDSESEAEETRVWLEFALRCGYISEGVFAKLDDQYDTILAQLVRMASEPDHWILQ